MVIVVKIYKILITIILTNCSDFTTETKGVKTMSYKGDGIKILNRDASKHVNKLEMFSGSNLWSDYSLGGSLYIVYSYNTHYPMYIYDKGVDVWYENTTWWSKTTSKHKSQARPNVECQGLDNEDMKEYVECGSMMAYMESKAKVA